MKVHHIGYLVKDIKKSIEQFEYLGYSVEQDIVYDDFRKINICFILNGKYRIELISPCSPDSVVSNMMKKMGNTPYHICYEVSNIDEAIIELMKKKYVSWDEPHEAVGIDGKRVVFLINRDIGMIELVETGSL